MKRERNWSDIIILLLLPAPLTFVGLMLLAVYVIASDSLTVTTGEAASKADSAAVSTLSLDAVAIATVSAAPVREGSSPSTVNTTVSESGEPAEVASAGGLNYDESLVAAGREDYLAICSACHGAGGQGVSGLGKPLIDSEFVHGLTDEELLQFIIKGRDIWDPLNTTGVAMPARGGSPILTDDEIRGIIAFIRVTDGVPAPGGADVAAAPATDTSEATTEDTVSTATEPVEFTFLTNADISAFLDSLGVNLEYAEPLPERTGEAVFNQFCGHQYEQDIYAPPMDACDYLGSAELDAEALTAILTNGNPIWSDPNGLGVHIPARLGYPPLNDNEIRNFVDYLLAE